jgi:2-oxoglutarate dehydrogenase E2 component (dihydrolipoamide succinyltransferase)
MATDIKVPSLGESVTEATVAKWLKRPGEAVVIDEPVAELETDKITLEIYAPAAGTLAEILADEGANVPVGAILGKIAEGAAASEAPHPPADAGPSLSPPSGGDGLLSPSPRLRGEGRGEGQHALERSGPAVRKLIEESRLDTTRLAPTGPGGRITKADVIAARAPPAPAPAASEREVRVRMTRLRRRIAERLKAAQNTAAMLTTFNEIDMTEAIALRERHRDNFEKKHGVQLGFMSIFLKAAIVALKELPAVNGEIDGEDIVYKNHYDIGVAVGTEQGLVVPVVRDADRMSFAEIERTIAALARKARDGKLTIEDLSGGTFTITNGGVYGSLMSTPILNLPRSGR